MRRKHGLLPKHEVRFVDQPEGVLIVKAGKLSPGKRVLAALLRGGKVKGLVAIDPWGGALTLLSIQRMEGWANFRPFAIKLTPRAKPRCAFRERICGAQLNQVFLANLAPHRGATHAEILASYQSEAAAACDSGPHISSTTHHQACRPRAGIWGLSGEGWSARDGRGWC